MHHKTITAKPAQWHVIALLGLLLATTGCLSDLRTQTVKTQHSDPANEAQGRAVLDRAWKAQGADKLQAKGTYSYTATDDWKGLLGKVGKPWPSAHAELAFKHDVGSFDAQVTFLNGKRLGQTAGLQSWHYYEILPGAAPTFKKQHARIRFGLAAFQYFFELADRLRQAPLIRYAGTTTWKGQAYELVLVTWDELAPHRHNDQYLVYVNAQTGILEYAAYTLRQNYLPGSGMLHGSIAFQDFREIEGIMVPHRQLVYIGGPRRNEKAYVHRFEVQDFQWDAFDPEVLRPDPEILPVGDAKVDGR